MILLRNLFLLSFCFIYHLFELFLFDLKGNSLCYTAFIKDQLKLRQFSRVHIQILSPENLDGHVEVSPSCVSYLVLRILLRSNVSIRNSKSINQLESDLFDQESGILLKLRILKPHESSPLMFIDIVLRVPRRPPSNMLISVSKLDLNSYHGFNELFSLLQYLFVSLKLL